MNTQFSQDELKNILVLISRSNITGQEALSVAMLQQKISKIINDKENEQGVQSGEQGGEEPKQTEPKQEASIVELGMSV